MTAVPLLQRHFSPLAANLLCVASMLIWSISLPAANVVLAVIPPLPLTAARSVMAAAALVPFWWLMEGGRALRRADWLRGIVIGGATVGLGAFFLVLGQSLTSAVTVAVISAMMPVVGMTLEVIFDGRRVTGALLFGLGLCLVGGVIALGARVEGLGLGWGALICLLSVIAFTIGSRMTVTSFPGLSPLGRTTITLTGAAIATTIAAAIHAVLIGPATQWSLIGPREFAALLLFSVGGLSIGQVLFIMAVGSIGIGFSTMHINATPFYVMILMYMMGSQWNWAQAAGAAVVGVGVLVAQEMIPIIAKRRAP